MLLGEVVYVTANMRDSQRGGFEPDLPEGCSYIEVAAPHRTATWRLYECGLEPRSPVGWPGVEVVPDGMQEVLRRASGNPRALTAARSRALDHLDGDTPALIDRSSFVRLFVTFLGESLDRIDDPSIELVILPADPDALDD